MTTRPRATLAAIVLLFVGAVALAGFQPRVVVSASDSIVPTVTAAADDHLPDAVPVALGLAAGATVGAALVGVVRLSPVPGPAMAARRRPSGRSPPASTST